MSTTFLLVRHGATAHTAQGRFSGSTGADPPLSTVGEEQAAALAERLRTRPVDAVVTSPMARARRTAEVLAGRLGADVHVDDDVRELDFGAWEGLTHPEVVGRWAAQLVAFRATSAVAPPGGESVDALAERVAAARQRWSRRHPHGTVLLVSHLYPVRVSVLDVLGAPCDAVHRMRLDPTSLTELHGATVIRYNDTGHLG